MRKEAGSGEKGIVSRFEAILYVLIPIVGLVALLNLPFRLTGISLYNQQYLALFWGLVTSLVFITRPGNREYSITGLLDILLAFVSLLIGLYVTIFYPQLVIAIGVINPFKVMLAFIAVLLVLESTRRLVGWPIVIIVLLFILYARYSYLMPAEFAAKGLTWPRLLNQLYLGADFLFGAPLRTAAMVVFGFIVFGQLLFEFGGGEFLIKLSLSLMGRFTWIVRRIDRRKMNTSDGLYIMKGIRRF